jgi:hypothetical protein
MKPTSATWCHTFPQDKAISRHFKSCVSAAEAAVAGREGALLVRKDWNVRWLTLGLMGFFRCLQKLTHKFNRLETLVVSKGAMMTYVVPSIMVRTWLPFRKCFQCFCLSPTSLECFQGQLEPDTAQVKLHVDTIEEFEKLRGQLTAVAKSSPEEQVRACQEFLAAVKTLLDTQVRECALPSVYRLLENLEMIT